MSVILINLITVVCRSRRRERRGRGHCKEAGRGHYCWVGRSLVGGGKARGEDGLDGKPMALFSVQFEGMGASRAIAKDTQLNRKMKQARATVPRNFPKI